MLYIKAGVTLNMTKEPTYLTQLREEKRRIEAAISALEQPILRSHDVAPILKRRPMSLETRAKMAKAQRERWSKVRKNAA